MDNPLNPRRLMLGAAKKLLLDEPRRSSAATAPVVPPRLTPNLLERQSMSRPRSAILGSLEEMYREALDRAKAAGDESQIPTLDFAFRREQLYFEILIDVRDALERIDAKSPERR